MDNICKDLLNTNRDDTFKYLIEKFKIKTVCEIGVLLGYFSETLLSFGLDKLTGIDIEKLPRIFELEKQYGRRYEVIIGDSLEVAKNIPDNSFDMVYLDGDHSYKYVSKELIAWWPKVKSGGIIAGHDFIVYEDKEQGPYGIVEAAMGFAEKHALKLYANGCHSTDLTDLFNLADSRGQIQKKIYKGKYQGHCEIPNFFMFKP